MPSSPAGRPSIRMKTTVWPSRRRASARSPNAPAATPSSSSSDSVPDHHGPAVDFSLDAFPGVGLKRLGRRNREPPFPGGRGDGGGQRMLARDLDAGGQPQQFRFVLPGHRHDRDHARLALGKRSGLVDDQSIDPLQNLERLGILDQHARGGSPAGTDHDRHRRRQPQRARAGDDQHRDGIDQGVSQPRLRTENCPCEKGDHGNEDHGRNEVRRDDVGQPLNGSPRAPRLADHADDLGEHRFARPPARPA